MLLVDVTINFLNIHKTYLHRIAAAAECGGDQAGIFFLSHSNGRETSAFIFQSWLFMFTPSLSLRRSSSGLTAHSTM